MVDRPRYYLTTSIAYANNKPGLHTLYEVIGADAIARWHRMLGDDTRSLTGTDEHWINIAQAALDEGRPTREFVDEKVALFKEGRGGPWRSAPDRTIRTTDADHVRAAQEMVRRARANGDIYLGTYEGWYCPNEGFRTAADVVETSGASAAEPPRRAPPVADRTQLVLPPVRLPGASSGATSPTIPISSAPSTGATRCSASSGAPRRLLDQPRADARRLGDPVPDRGRTARLRCARTGPWDPEAGKIYVWYDALIDYITAPGSRTTRPRSPLVARRPPRDRQGHRPIPHDLLAGDAVERGLEPRVTSGSTAGCSSRAASG